MERLLVLILAAVFAAPVHAQDWPKQRAFHIVVPFPTGSMPDLVARLVAPKLAAISGQATVIENRTGAAGNVGAQVVKRAAADGYTLLVTGVGLVVNVALFGNPGYELREFLPVMLGPSTPTLIAVNPAVPAKNLQELIALARNGEMSYASAGVGTATHLSMERLKAIAKFELTHIPFQPAQATVAAIAGHTEISSTTMPPAVNPVNAGRLRAIAVTSAQRSAALPNVPTVNEQGFSGFDDSTWTGFFLRAGTPQDIVNQLNSDLNAALLAPEVQTRLAKHRFEWKANTAGEFAAFLRGEVPKWAKAVKDSGARAD
jgi:tripartite-type tricarboxylate transporter receptor subunit TctC